MNKEFFTYKIRSNISNKIRTVPSPDNWVYPDGIFVKLKEISKIHLELDWDWKDLGIVDHMDFTNFMEMCDKAFPTDYLINKWQESHNE